MGLFIGMTYSDKLRDPRWQKRRLEVFQRDGFKCCDCDSESETLHVHHRYYVRGREPWNYPLCAFQTLCKDCHEAEQEQSESGWQIWEWLMTYFSTSPSNELQLLFKLDNIRCWGEMSESVIFEKLNNFASTLEKKANAELTAKAEEYNATH